MRSSKWHKQYVFKCLISGMIFLLTGSYLTGQVNVKIGYGMGFLSSDVNTAVVDAFNAKYAEILNLEKPMPDLKFMHGIELGLRYKFNRLALNAGWENISRDRRAIGEFDDGSLFEEKLYYSMNSFYAGIESIYSNIGFGARVGTARFRVKDNIATSDEKKTIVSGHHYFTRIHFTVLFGGQKYNTFGLQPFIQIPLAKVDLSGLANEFDLDAGIETEAKLMLYGLSLVFYNGPQ